MSNVTNRPEISKTDPKDNAAIIYPEIDANACVLSRTPLASCTNCIDICPHDAWVMTDESLGLDMQTCTGCGMCRGACPEQAIDLPFKPARRQTSRSGYTLYIACAPAFSTTSSNVETEGVVPCLHAISSRDIVAWAQQGLERVIATRADCAECINGLGSRDPFAEALHDANTLRCSRGQVEVESLMHEPETWRKTLWENNKAADLPDQRKRRLLRAFTRTADAAREAKPDFPPGALFFATVTIDAEKCTGCDACVRICPHRAIRLERGAVGLVYEFDPASCTRCGLCRDLCEDDAVTLHSLAAFTQSRLVLHSDQCRKCGAPFHLPIEGAGVRSELCRICKQSNHYSRLYQVDD